MNVTRQATAIVARSLLTDVRTRYIADTLTILRNGLPQAEMLKLVTDLNGDRHALIKEALQFVEPLIDGGVKEELVVAMVNALTALATHDTLTVLLNAAALHDADCEPA